MGSWSAWQRGWMSSCLLLPSYVSIAARKRGRLTKVAGECHLKSWRIRGACQFGPDSPICTCILGSRYFRKDCCEKLNLLLCHRNNIVFQVKLKTILVPEKCKHQSSTPNMPEADVALHLSLIDLSVHCPLPNCLYWPVFKCALNISACKRLLPIFECPRFLSELPWN